MIQKYPKAHLLIPLAAPQPLLEQIFIERVPKCPHAGVLLTPLASLGVQVVRVELLGPAQANGNGVEVDYEGGEDL